MTIPKGIDYGFTITVVEKDSFLPQDLVNMDTVNSSFKLCTLGTLCDVVIGTATITRLADEIAITNETTNATTNAYVIGSFVHQTTSDIYYECIAIAPAGTLLTNVLYFNPITLVSITTYKDGRIKVVLDKVMTGSLEYSRGEAVDNYYLKPTYQGVINIKFLDGTSERTAIIDKIYVAPTGAVCV